MRIHGFIRAVPLAIATTLGASGCLVSAEAEIPEIDVVRQDIKFEGVSKVAGLANNAALSHSFEWVHQKVDPPAALEPELYPTEVILTARQGVSDLSFLRGLSLSMQSEGESGKAATPIINYAQSSKGSVGPELSLPCVDANNVFDQLRSGKAIFTLSVTGLLPERAWSIDVTVRLTGRVKYKS